MRNLRAVAAAAVMLVATSVAGEARAACWNAEEVTAAAVRDLQSLMMVATLRCQAAGFEIAPEYNGFLRANKATIQAMNDRLKLHFIRGAGPVEGQHAYDSFTTTLANAYGAGATNGDVCQGTAALAREAAMMAGSAEGLVLLAGRQGLAPALPDGACATAPVAVAATASAAPPTAAAALLLAAAAPVPEQPPVATAQPAVAMVSTPAAMPAPATAAAPVPVAAQLAVATAAAASPVAVALVSGGGAR